MRALAALAVAAALLATPAAAGLRYVAAPVPAEAVVDSRDETACARRTLAPAAGGLAVCLPPAALLDARGRLVGPRALLWRLGTLGLTGAETALVVGDDAEARDFVAGVLHLAGQAEVAVLARPVTPLLAQADTTTGTPPAMTRQAVFTAPMRDERVILRHELAARLRAGGVLLLDARPEDAFWHDGHVPGAQPLPAGLLRQAPPPVLPPPPERPAVVYGAHARDGIAAYTLLTAGFGVDAVVYPGGWAEWSAMGRGE